MYQPKTGTIRGAIVTSLLLLASAVTAKPGGTLHEISPIQHDIDIVGPVDAGDVVPQKAQEDTLWIADWSFDDGSPCSLDGWVSVDNRAFMDATDHWFINSDFNALPAIDNLAAVVTGHDLCWVFPDGYDNNWNTAICLEYTGGSFLSFDYAVDSEAGFDFLQVEVDSACASFAQACETPGAAEPAGRFRRLIFQANGFNDDGSVDSLSLPDFGTLETHCAYISFFADGAFSPADGLQPTTLGAAIVIDNIVIVGGTNASEDFEDGDLDLPFSFRNIQDAKSLGTWGRTFPHITDNDACTENQTCALLWTDYTTPTLASTPELAFGPGSYVVKNWLDEALVSPWVDLSATPQAVGTVLSFRRFGGNFFAQSRLIQRWSVRSQKLVDNTDTPAPGDSVTCISDWDDSGSNTLGSFTWVTAIFNMDGRFDPADETIQIRFRISDWQWIAGASPPNPHNPGPGPFIDRVRIGRRVLSGPAIDEGNDSRSQGQDAFPTQLHTGVSGPPQMQPWRPMDVGPFDRFGTVAFSRGGDLGINYTTANLITGDSITVEVLDVRNAGGVTSVDWYGAIVSGPHQGKAPPPHVVGGNGFFVIAAENSRTSQGSLLPDCYFIDVDDEYLLGGDVVQYFWLAGDAGGGFASNPEGLTAVPASLAEAQSQTGGLFEVNALPAVEWDPDLLDDIANETNGVGPGGKVDPSSGAGPPEWFDDNGGLPGAQTNCILYYQGINARRRSGNTNRTTFMYTLDNLGYRDRYDVYDHQGVGNTNNHLGGRATTSQARGYDLVVYDAGNSAPDGFIVPDGSDLDAQKIQQDVWFRNWLAEGSSAPASRGHTLWLIGANAVEERPSNLLYTQDMGVSFVASNQSAAVNPDLSAVADFTFWTGSSAAYTQCTDFSLEGGCAILRDFDAIDASGGTSVVTHRYRSPGTGTLAEGALVMNANVPGKSSTVMQTFPAFDVRPLGGPNGQGTPPGFALRALVEKTLNAVLPLACPAGDPSTGVGTDPLIDAGTGTDDVAPELPESVQSANRDSLRHREGRSRATAHL